MNKTFYLELITPERSFFKGEVEMLVVGTEDGEMGILADHMPIAAIVKTGSIRFLTDGVWREAANSEGFLEIRPDETVLLAQTLEWPEEIEINRVRERIEESEEQLRQAKNLQEYRLSKAALARAVARLKVRSHYNKEI